MKEHPTDRDLVKEGTRRKVGAFTAIKTVVTSLAADLGTAMRRLRNRFRR